MDILRYWHLWQLAVIETGALLAGLITTSTAFAALTLLPH
jgi:hypothetical protein